MTGRLLVIEGDELLAARLRQHFENAGYDVSSATSGDEGLSLAGAERPNLILLALQLPDRSGRDVFRVLRDQPRTGHVPVMVLAEGDQLVLQKDLLEEGAYDFIEKPLDLDILSLRVRNALRRAEREGLTETRTGLPTGRLIEERLSKLDDEDDWYRIDLEIAEFGVFRDLYGFVTANEALRFAGNLMEQIVHEQGDPADFVGHFSGTEQFVVVTAQARGPALHDTLVNRISDELQSFYNFMERDQGFVLVEDGSGGQVQKPLMSTNTTVTQPNPDAYSEDVWVDAVEEDDEPPEDSSPGSTFEW